jgi:hypothetical protein
VKARKTIDEGKLIFKDFERNMHFTNRAVVLSADYADYADRNKENLRSSMKSVDSKHRSLLSA